VEHAVPLRAIFFLSQAEEDRVEPRSPGQAIAMLMEVAGHVARLVAHSLAPRQIQALRREQLSIVQALARAMPVHTLYVSLSGAFWTEIERVLPKRQTRDASSSLPAQRQGRGRPLNVESWLDDGLLHFAYRGPSMNPTLREPDLVDVRPYGTRPIQRGDVIYYRQPEDDKMVVHRVVGVSSGSVRTRGDNNLVADPYLLHVEDIRGQVIGAQRGSRRRSIAGGWRGMGMAYGLRLWHYIRRAIAACLGGLYRALTRSGVLLRLLPKRLRPRVVVFDSLARPAYKLLMGSREIGRYDYRDRRWQIRRPLRLLVQEAELPHPEPPQPALARRMSAQRDVGK
ncbi:MAG: signal peptidase I, partial [Anaerolineae bacterium]|nr:signal peptidase I [Anaerolineae bacterium]